MPGDNKSQQKDAAIVAQFEAVGIALPADFTFETDGFRDILLAALKTATLAKETAEAENETPDEDITVREESNAMAQQFDEATLAAMSPVEKALLAEIESGKTKLTQFTEERTAERTATAQAKLVAKIKTSGVPPGMRDQMLSRATAVQFGEDGEAQPLYTPAEVVDLFAQFIPKHLQFAEKDAEETKQPESVTGDEKKKGMHVDAARAKELSDQNAAGWTRPGSTYENPNGPSAGAGRTAAKPAKQSRSKATAAA